MVVAAHVSNRSAGLSKPSIFLDRSFTWRFTLLSCACEYADKSVPLEYCLSRPLVFSLEPLCHRLCVSALYLGQRSHIAFVCSDVFYTYRISHINHYLYCYIRVKGCSDQLRSPPKVDTQNRLYFSNNHIMHNLFRLTLT